MHDTTQFGLTRPAVSTWQSDEFTRTDAPWALTICSGTRQRRHTTAQRAQNRRQEHVGVWVFFGEQIIYKPPWGSVRAAFFQKGRQNHLFAVIDASPLLKRETQHKTYTLHPSRKRERRRSIYGPASRRNLWSEERFLFSQTHICKDLTWDGL